MRAFVVTKLTAAAGAAIPASEFSFPIYGPIFCGTIAGCGGAFLPLNKGLDPIKKSGLASPMFSAFVGATFYHLFTNLATEVIDVEKKAKVIVALFFIIYGMHQAKIFKLYEPPPITKSSIVEERKRAAMKTYQSDELVLDVGGRPSELTPLLGESVANMKQEV